MPLHAGLESRTVGKSILARQAAFTAISDFRGPAAVMTTRPQRVPVDIGFGRCRPIIPQRTTTVPRTNAFIALSIVGPVAATTVCVCELGRLVQRLKQKNLKLWRDLLMDDYSGKWIN
jgi:hypothetical protein